MCGEEERWGEDTERGKEAMVKKKEKPTRDAWSVVSVLWHSPTGFAQTLRPRPSSDRPVLAHVRKVPGGNWSGGR